MIERFRSSWLIAGLKSQQDVTRAAIFTGNGDLFTIILEHFKTVAATSSKCSVAFATSWRGRLVGQARHQPGSSVARPRSARRLPAAKHCGGIRGLGRTGSHTRAASGRVVIPPIVTTRSARLMTNIT